MSDKERNTFNTETNSLMGMFEKYKKADQEQVENYKKQHMALIKNSEALKKFYGNAVRLDTWLLQSEAIPYFLAIEPSQWFNIKSEYKQWMDALNPLIKAGVGATLTITNPDAKEKEWRVTPKEFVKWLHTKKIRPRKELEEVLGLQYKNQEQASKTNSHGNSEINAQKREQVLIAALSVLARWPEKCKKKNGKISPEAISKMIEQKSNIWFGYEELPLEPSGMTRLISKALKTTDD